MNKFINQLVKYLIIPNIILAAFFYITDTFSIFANHREFYKNQTFMKNRTYFTTESYNSLRKEKNFNSFIFGSSRSQAFKCKDWDNFIEQGSKSFHFDGSGEGIWNIYKKIKYIDQTGDIIKNALVVIDHNTLARTKPQYGHLFIEHPNISKESWSNFYFQYFKLYYNIKFLLTLFDYSIFKDYRSYMRKFIKEKKNYNIVDYSNCDIWYGYDEDIKEDSLGYYSNLFSKGVFYKRLKKHAEIPITDDLINQLNFIKTIFIKHNTSFKIVISPTYDQFIINNDLLSLLDKIFGKKKIYNFSGQNQFTNEISNYYENSHYKPLVARKILRIIYFE